MKPSTVPTAPALRAQRTPRRIGWLVLTVTLSLVAGSTGAIFTLSIPVQWPGIERWLNLSNSEVLVIPPSEDTGTAALVSNIQDRQFDAVVQLQVEATERGVGVMLSNDGWLMTPSTNVATDETVTVILASGKEVISDQVIVDDYSGATFIHIPKTNLPIVDLRTQTVTVGDAAVVVQPTTERRTTVWSTHLLAVDQPLDGEFSTVRNNVIYVSDRALSGVRIGAPIFDYQAQVMGIVIDEQTILPIAAITGRLQQLLHDETLVSPSLNVTYELSNQGAKVLSASTAELMVDDLIIEAGDVTITTTNDLSWALQESTRTTVSLRIIRQGEKKTVDVRVD